MRTLASELKNLRGWLKSYIDQRINMVFGWTLTANSSPLGDQDQVATSDDSGEQRPARRIEPWGHKGRPPSKVRSFWCRLGSSNIFFIGVAPSSGYGPTDLEVGETSLYCVAGGTEIRLDKDGNVRIVAADAKKVQIVATAITGSVELGPDGGPNDQVLIKGSLDSLGAPVTQAPLFSTTTVKAG